MENLDDLIKTAEWQIASCGRPSAKVSKELLSEVIRLKHIADIALDAIEFTDYYDRIAMLKEAIK